ncbi:MAG TPA: DUF1573 domain-containing protein [Verrucomicrobiae bacterium]
MIKRNSSASASSLAATAIVIAVLRCGTFTRGQERAATADYVANSDPVIRVDAAPYDFGLVREGDVVTPTYFVTNVGGKTLVISRVQPSCGCTTAGDYTKKIESGRTGTISVQFNSDRKSGPVTKTIQVFSNATNEARTA